MFRKIFTILACLAFSVTAQPQQGTLSGDIAGLGGKSATLILTNVSTGAVERVTPKTDGSFTVSLQPGTYKVEVEREGFRQSATQNVTVPASGSAQLNIIIQGGPVIEAVEVKASSPGVQDSGSEVGEGFSTSTVRTLPVFDRN